jgi:hypothetical protein
LNDFKVFVKSLFFLLNTFGFWLYVLVERDFLEVGLKRGLRRGTAGYGPRCFVDFVRLVTV